jgi:FlaA1/EpsC-like NDP-sugar epimerase
MHFSVAGSNQHQRPCAAALTADAPNPVIYLLRGAVAWLQEAGDGHIPGAQSAVDSVIVGLSFLLAYLVRYEGVLSRPHLVQLLLWLPVLVIGRIVFLRKLGVHRFLWRFVCLSDAVAIARSMTWITAAMICLRWLYPVTAPLAYWLRIPMGIAVCEFLLSLGGLLVLRGASRLVQERIDRAAQGDGRGRRRVVLYGAGRAGVLLARELATHGGIEIIGFVDDDPLKAGTVIAGIRVLGQGSALESLVRKCRVDEVLISIAAANPKTLTDIVARCKAIQVKHRIVPSAEEIISGRVNISHVRETRIEELLGRSSVTHADFSAEARSAYESKRVLVTGAGGSIGSELCRQLLLLKPATLAILDKDENSIFELDHELRLRAPDVPVEPLIADMKIRERIETVFSEFRPQVVLHAAAHKHVPLMEKHPCEAVLNNVMGLNHILGSCRSLGVERFVFISSDKAVNPTNVMGATKRLGEKLLSAYAVSGAMKAASVRFGNVIGSRGSVIPLFKRQIEAGGPVTVTHPDMVRFFMTIREAVHLVLCAGSLASRAETYVLDMGNPRRVLDMARQMIELEGLEPDKDIAISITGLRPGEKMEEELACPGESLHATTFEKIFEIPQSSFDGEVLRHGVEALVLAARNGDRGGVSEMLASMGLGYVPSASGLVSQPAHLEEIEIATCAP